MRNVRAPSVPEVPVPIVSDTDMRLLFKSVNGTTFEQRRDAAILRVLHDCGVRLSELTGLGRGDVNWALHALLVVGKGSRPRSVPFAPVLTWPDKSLPSTEWPVTEMPASPHP
jgi:site-specific recombinase XerC